MEVLEKETCQNSKVYTYRLSRMCLVTQLMEGTAACFLFLCYTFEYKCCNLVVNLFVSLNEL